MSTSCAGHHGVAAVLSIGISFYLLVTAAVVDSSVLARTVAKTTRDYHSRDLELGCSARSCGQQILMFGAHV